VALKFRVSQKRGMSRVAERYSASSSSYIEIAYRLRNYSSKISAMTSALEKIIWNE
jgi:hypothetical protein